MIRIIGASLYRPPKTPWPTGRKRPTVSVVTPVYNENHALFIQSLESWVRNGVDEIIAVIDKTNVHLIAEFERYYSKRKDVRCKMLVTAKPGKRAALCDGISKAESDLIALVDSDTVWGNEVAVKVIPFFLDPKIGAVTVEQRIMNPDTTSNVLFDILLWTRYREEVPFLLGLGKAFNTLSGRTAIYRREAIFNSEHDNLHSLRHESFLGARAISGDDKRLTHLILEQGWHVGFAKGAVVYTQGLNKMRTFLKQRTRWMRNSWRADLRAFKRGWVWKHPVLAFFMFDRFIQPFFMLLGPVVFVIAIITRQWLVVAVLVSWWLTSRSIRLFSYFRHYPTRLIYLPIFILYTYYNAVAKIYALATVLENSWVTRWHQERLRKALIRRWAITSVGLLAIVSFLGLMYYFATRINQATAAYLAVPNPVGINEFNLSNNRQERIVNTPALPADAILPTGVSIYVVQAGDTMEKLALRFKMPLNELKRLNGIRSANKINVGQNILYYSQPSSVQGDSNGV
ncbi:glycosyltransferase [Candidatus Saccharibacteria bacterium]|nr:glycosyltransferase [Candidatus Saccharibacteria bacterium]